MCAPLNSTNELEWCDEKHNSCSWSRIYCCDQDNCNTDKGNIDRVAKLKIKISKNLIF